MNTKVYAVITATFLIILTTGLYMMNTTDTHSSFRGGDLDPEEFREKLQSRPGLIIDVRTPEEYEAGHLADADRFIDFNSGEFEREMENLDPEQTYYLYCRSGARSGKAMEMMQKAGFNEVYNVGGYSDLVSSGFPADR